MKPLWKGVFWGLAIEAVAAALVLLCVGWAGATNYYVDCNAANDSDTGVIGHPWKTISKVNSSSFSGDDQILFNRGCTWREQLTVPSSGTSGHPITFGAYGTGALPVISGADLVTGPYTLLGYSGTSISDDFNRANGALGANWGTVAYEQGPVISSNHAFGSTDGIIGYAVWSADSFTADQCAQATVSGSGWGTGILIRGWSTIDSESYYDTFYAFLARAATNSYVLTKRVKAGAITTLGTYSASPSNGDVLKFCAIGSTLTGYVNGTARITATDVDIPSGSPGVAVYGNTAGTSLDDFSGQSADTGLYTIYTTTIATPTKAVIVDGTTLLIPAQNGIETLGMSTTQTLAGHWDRTGTGPYTLYLNVGGDPATHTIEMGVRSSAIYSTGKSYFNVDGLSLRGTNDYAMYTTGAAQYASLLNSHIELAYAGWNIIGASLIGHFTIDKSFIGNLHEQGLQVYNTAATKVDTVTITNSEFGPNHWGTATNSNNMYLVKISGFTLLDSYLHDPLTVSQPGGNPIWAHHEHNIYSDGVQNGEVARNRFFNSDMSGLKIDNQSRSGTSPWHIHNNIFWKSGQGPISTWSDASDIYVYNNTIVGGKSPVTYEPPSTYGPMFTSQMNNEYNHPTVNAVFRNNIVAGWSDGYAGCTRTMFIPDSTAATMTSDHNLIYCANGGNVFYNGTSEFTVAGWNARNGLEANDVITDPKFVDAAAGDFHLQAGSPAIGAGVDVGLTTDFAGNVFRSPPSLGAFEIPSAYLVSDPYLESSGLAADSFTIQETGQTDVIVPATSDGNGGWYLHYDLSTSTYGDGTVHKLGITATKAGYPDSPSIFFAVQYKGGQWIQAKTTPFRR